MQRKGARVEAIAAIVFIIFKLCLIAKEFGRLRLAKRDGCAELRMGGRSLGAHYVRTPCASLAQPAKGSHPCLTTTGFVELRGYIGRAILVCGLMGCAIFERRRAVS